MASSTASIGGLASGLDTTSIISSLMQLEAKPQTLLKTRMSAEQTNVTSLQSLNAKFAALASKAKDLSTATAWSPLSAKSSSDKVVATAGSTAAAGDLTFTVQSTASAHQLAFASSAARSDVVTTGSTMVRLTTSDGTVLDLETGDGTLAGLADALNDPSTGVNATTVKLDDGSYRLRVTSSSTGAASSFTLTNTDGSDLLGGATVAAGRDAAITVGSDTLHSSSNVFAGVLTGLDLTLSSGIATGTEVTVTTTRDAAKAQSAVKGLVDDANAILAQIDSLTAYDATTKKSGALSGDSTVRDLRSRLLETVTRAADGSSLAGLGIQTDRNGQITFDATKFATAYASDPAMVAAKLGAPDTATTPGFASRLAAVATTASEPRVGVLSTDIIGRQSSVTTMQKSIDDWDVKLEAKQDSLKRTYSALEVALGKLQNQSSWLQGQLNSLSSNSSSNS